MVLFRFVSVRALPLSVIRLLPLDDRDTLPPPESITFDSITNVAPALPALPNRLIEPELLTGVPLRGNEPPSSISMMPPAVTMVLLRTPPDEMKIVPPTLTVVLLATPPASMTCEPVKTVAPLAEPKTFWTPPEICPPLSIPPNETLSVPPAKILVGSATPPEDTNNVPPLTIVVLIVRPPDFTTSRPLVSTVVPLA